MWARLPHNQGRLGLGHDGIRDAEEPGLAVQSREGAALRSREPDLAAHLEQAREQRPPPVLVEMRGHPADARDYLAAAKILQAMGVDDVRLLTNNPDKTSSLESYGVPVAERVPLTPRPNDHNLAYLLTKRDRMGHHLPDLGRHDHPPVGDPAPVAGQAPAGGWRIRVQDISGRPEDTPTGPSAVVAIHNGGLATSSTAARRWRRGGDVLHHILDPRTGLPAAPVWRTVSVAAASCADANTASTAAIIRGREAPGWLTGLGLPARLVDEAGTVHTVAGWPAEGQVPDEI